MANPPNKDTITNRAQIDPTRVIDVCKKLWDGHVQDLNIIDGEFFFRCVRPHCGGWLSKMERMNPRDPNQFWEFDHAVDLLWVHYGLPRQMVIDAVLDGQWLRLRTPNIEITPSGQPDDRGEACEKSHLSMDIYAYTKSGHEVADVLADASQVPPRADNIQAADYESPWTVDIAFVPVGMDARSSFAREAIDDGGVWFDVEYITPDKGYYIQRSAVEPPHIRMVVGLPLPGPEVIAASYDAMCRETAHWMQHIRPSVDQGPETAMRTWVVALLMATGKNFGQALGQWESEFASAQGVGRSQFNREKEVLLVRVPEAVAPLRIRNANPFWKS